MSESAPQFEKDPQRVAAEVLVQSEHIVSVEPSPYIQLVENYELDPALKEKLEAELGAQFETFLDLLEGIKIYLRGPLIKDNFGNYHQQGGVNDDTLSRREFVRSFGEATAARQLLDQNRLKIGTHTNAIFPRLELLKMLAPDTTTLGELFRDLPTEAYEKLSQHEELSEEDKEQWVREMDSFAVHLLERTGVK
jgi:hypothetical protein